METCRPERQLLYTTALLTGLRAGELRMLSLGHLDLDAGGLRLDAAWTKNRQTGFQPLPPALLAALAAAGQSGWPGERYARVRARYGYPDRPLLYVPTRTASSLAGDLRRAGIPRQTPEGIVDFHALRLTFINLTIDAGATPTEAQRLARPQTPQMTLGVYGRTHDTRLQVLVDDIAAQVLPTTLRASGMHAQVVGRAEPASFLAYRGSFSSIAHCHPADDTLHGCRQRHVRSGGEPQAESRLPGLSIHNEERSRARHKHKAIDSQGILYSIWPMCDCLGGERDNVNVMLGRYRRAEYASGSARLLRQSCARKGR
jgi:hypothetical protein